MSRTVTVKLQTFEFPLASAATQMTPLVPREKNEPEGGVQTTVTLVSQTSAAVATKETVLPPAPAHSVTRLLEQNICEGVVSSTVTVKLQVLVFPLSSVATQTTPLVPREKNEPEGGAQTTVTLVSQMSVAGMAKETVLPPVPAHSTTRLLEQEICGGVVSRTVTVKLQEFEFPLASVATQMTPLVPRGKNEPEGGVQTTLTLVSQTSVAVMAKEIELPPAPAHSVTRLLEQEICGGVVSTMCTIRVLVAEFPLESVAM